MIALGLKWWWSFGSYSDYVFAIFCSLTFYFLTFHFSFTWRLLKKKKKKNMTPPFLRSWMILMLSYSSAINLTCSSIPERILSALWCVWYGILSVSFVKEFGSLGDEPLHVNLFLKLFSIFFLRFFFNREGGKWVFVSLGFVLVGNIYFCWIKLKKLGIKTWPGFRWIDNWRVLTLVSLGTDIILLV